MSRDKTLRLSNTPPVFPSSELSSLISLDVFTKVLLDNKFIDTFKMAMQQK